MGIRFRLNWFSFSVNDFGNPTPLSDYNLSLLNWFVITYLVPLAALILLHCHCEFPFFHNIYFESIDVNIVDAAHLIVGIYKYLLKLYRPLIVLHLLSP